MLTDTIMLKNKTSFIAIFILLAAVLGCNQTSTNSSSNANISEGQNNTNLQIESGGGEVKADDPALLVTDLYKQHDAKKSPFFQKDRARIDKYFTKGLGDLILRDATKPVDEVGALGADPLYDGQDFEIKKFAVGKAVVEGEKATVPVTFENFGESKKVNLSLVLADNVWKISDIKYDHGVSLFAVLKEAYGDGKTNAPPVKNVAGEFEGTYRIGDTTCTVKPVKQAFEVRWAKGSGTEMFFFKDANVFESEPDKSGGRNEFQFDDENYNTGTFIRADGKTMPIRRTK